MDRIRNLTIGLLTFLWAPLLWAQEALPDPKTTEEIVGIIGQLVAAAKGGHWALVAAFGIMVAVWALRKFFWKSLPAKAIPWVAAGVGVLLSFAATLQGGASWTQAVVVGLVTGSAASGLWSMVGKHLLGGEPKKEEPKGEGEASSTS